MDDLSYILKLRNSLKTELRNMPIFQNGSALIVLIEMYISSNRKVLNK